MSFYARSRAPSFWECIFYIIYRVLQHCHQCMCFIISPYIELFNIDSMIYLLHHKIYYRHNHSIGMKSQHGFGNGFQALAGRRL